uniref:Uncharacterized protein n=1 Tax=Lepeophtheirus salmonis TaxID=72036 RepID=A0A0K2V351_LEPSM
MPDQLDNFHYFINIFDDLILDVHITRTESLEPPFYLGGSDTEECSEFSLFLLPYYKTVNERF